MSLGKRIKMVRNKAGLSLKNVAKKSSVTVSFLSQVERDKATPSLKSLKNIANALGVRTNQLLDEDRSSIKRVKICKKGSSSYIVLENGDSLRLYLE